MGRNTTHIHRGTYGSCAFCLAIAGVIGLGLAPMATAEPLLTGPAVAGPSNGINPEPPATPVSQQNSVRVAENYKSVMGFSRSGLIEQLVSIHGSMATAWELGSPYSGGPT